MNSRFTGESPSMDSRSLWQRFVGACDRNVSWLMPLPAMMVTALLMIFPLGYLVYMSFHDWLLIGGKGPQFIHLQNYLALFQDERFISSLGRTGIFIILGLIIQVPFGVAIAVLFNEHFPGRGIMRTLLLLPMVATPVAMALIWVIMMDPSSGILNYFLSWFGIRSVAWLSDVNVVIPALVLVDTWQWTPMVALICLAGLSALPIEPFEAAMIDGASVWQRFWKLTLPMVWPTLLVAILFRFIDLLKVIEHIYVMTRGGPGFASETINLYNFLMGLFYYRVGYGSSISVVIFALVLGASLILIRARRTSW
ncbi:MAG TPA: sugar ABC transporter permease [Thermodesulfobacteriota bacterium]|nr:sugar ABC transporter permease [Thermodesulfobacteriota bacterium]